MDTFDHLLNWKLQAGSHRFPGPDGGTCINEAAVVAAGFAYQRIDSVETMPACFSRPVCELAMYLNDQASDADRQRLLPYVTRLACADTPEIEARRAAYIQMHTRGYPRGIPFEEGLKVLDRVLEIGRQADPFPAHEVQSRMEAVKVTGASLTSVPDRPFFAKVKSWFKTKESEPAA